MRRSIKNIFPIPGFQLRFIILGYISGLVLTILYLGTFFLYIKKNFLEVLQMSTLSLEVRDVLRTDMENVIQGLIIISVLFLIAVVLVCIFYSHKIAGPISKLIRTMDEVLENKDSEKIVFRNKDEFHELADRFNKVISHLNIKNNRE